MSYAKLKFNNLMLNIWYEFKYNIFVKHLNFIGENGYWLEVETE